MLLGCAVMTLGAEWVLRRIANRPAVIGTALEAELTPRRLSAHRVLRGVQLLIAANLAIVLLVAAATVSNVDLPSVAAALGILAGVVAIGAAVLALLPGPRPAVTLSPAATLSSDAMTPGDPL